MCSSTSAWHPYDLYGDLALEDQSVASYACEAPLALGKEGYVRLNVWQTCILLQYARRQINFKCDHQLTQYKPPKTLLS